jgi:hypothetical protein
MSDAARLAEQVVADLSIRDPADLDVQAIAWELGAFVREEALDAAAARIAAMAKRQSSRFRPGCESRDNGDSLSLTNLDILFFMEKTVRCVSASKATSK